jgi:peptidoglycan/LPS O-acetylase OafA/YrhL
MEFDFRFSETASINLDIIRVIAIQNVAVAHGMAMMRLIPPITPGVFGSISFPLIFLLSGIFTSYSLLIKEKQKNYDFTKYFFNRVSRIYPSYLLSVVFLIIIDLFFVFSGESLATYDILTLILNIFFLNDSVFNIPNFGSSYNLWTLPNFWWSYLFLGWFILGKKDLRRKYKYFGILATFAFMIIAVYLGPWYKAKIIGDTGLFFIWICGIFITIILNRYNRIIKKKRELDNNWFGQEKINKIFLYLSLILFTFGSIGALFILDLTPYDIEYLVILVASVFFFLIYSQYAEVKYKERFKKIIRFMASYTFTLYIVHFSLFNFLTIFLEDINSVLLFFIGYFSSNILSILIAELTERRSYKLNKYLLKKFNIE